MGSGTNSKYSRNRRMKYIILFLCLTGFTFSQELQQAKDALAEQAIELNELRKTNKNLVNMVNSFVADLRAIENPSEGLRAVMEKYQLFPETSERKE